MRKTFNLLRLPVRLALSVIFIMSVVSAGARDVDQARQAALQQMKAHAARKAGGKGTAVPTVSPQLLYSKARGAGEAYYYVFTAGENLGYTVVSGDDRLPAIVGYTENGSFDARQMPDAMKDFMQQYEIFVDNATDEQIARTVAFKAAAKHAKVEPFMPEKWNQMEPYNNLCPEYAPGERAVTGCVATAVAQILHYWSCERNSPVSVSGEIPEYSYYGLPSVPAGTEYDWANMPNVYSGGETEEQNLAVATLMLHIGSAVRMQYGPSSGANACPETFTNYFGMDKDFARQIRRDSYNLQQWDNILYDEMAARRPVYYDGATVNRSGHAFVIHGYDDGLYYVNWGWGGYCDGYFDITILNPNSNAGAGASSGNDGYSTMNSMIVGIQPDNGEADYLPGTAMLASGIVVRNLYVSDNMVTGNLRCTMETNNLYDNIFVGVGYIDGDGKCVNVSTPSEIDAKEYGNGTLFYRNIDVSFTYEEGKRYELCLIESKDKETWTACLRKYGNASLIMEVKNGELIVPDLNWSLSATVALNDDASGIAGFVNRMNVTVENTGDKEYYNPVYVSIRPSGTGDYKYIYQTGITAAVGGSTTFNFDYTPDAGGDYDVKVTDINDNILCENVITFKDEVTEAPVLSFVSIKCKNVSEERILADYNVKYDTEMITYRVNVDKVNDTKAEFEFVVLNDGGYYEGEFVLYEYNALTGQWPGSLKYLKMVPGENVFTFTVEGKAGDVVGLELYGYGVYVAGLEDPNIHNVESGGWFPFDYGEIVYLAGTGSDGIADVVTGARDNGVLYNLRGEKVTAPGKGLYIRNGKKYVIK